MKKKSDFMKIEGACHPVISVCPFKVGMHDSMNNTAMLQKRIWYVYNS